MAHWTHRLTKPQRSHLSRNCMPNEGLQSKKLAIERATKSANLGCHECRAIVNKLTEEEVKQ